MYIAIATDSKEISKEIHHELSNLCFQKNISTHISNIDDVLEQASLASSTFLSSYLGEIKLSKDILEKSHLSLFRKNIDFAKEIVESVKENIEKSNFIDKNPLSLKIIVGINNAEAHLVLDKPLKVYIRNSDLKQKYDLEENADIIYAIKDVSVKNIALDLLTKLDIGVKS